MGEARPQHAVTLFSNGMADFVRTLVLRPGESQRVSIPVRKQHVADVLASVNFYGPVRLTKPLSYRPANDTEGTLTLATPASPAARATARATARCTSGRSGLGTSS